MNEFRKEGEKYRMEIYFDKIIICLIILFIYAIENIVFFKKNKYRKIKNIVVNIPEFNNNNKIKNIITKTILNFYKILILKSILIGFLLVLETILLKTIYYKPVLALIIIFFLYKMLKPLKNKKYNSGNYTLFFLIVPYFIFLVFGYNSRQYIIYFIVLILELILFFIYIYKFNIIKKIRTQKINPVKIFDEFYENISNITFFYIKDGNQGEIDYPERIDTVFLVIEGVALIETGGKKFKVSENEAVCIIDEEVRVIKSIGDRKSVV